MILFHWPSQNIEYNTLNIALQKSGIKLYVWTKCLIQQVINNILVCFPILLRNKNTNTSITHTSTNIKHTSTNITHTNMNITHTDFLLLNIRESYNIFSSLLFSSIKVLVINISIEFH